MNPADEAARVAAGLTSHQRKWLKEGCHGDISMRMVRTLIGKRLWYIRIDSPDGRCGFAEPTELGTAVRNHLQAQERRDGR